MAHLVYGIMKGPVVIGGPIAGVRGKEVFFVTGQSLCAAVSEMPPEGAPPVSELLAYGRVVEYLYQVQAVVPMRYGCFLGGIPEIQRILEQNKRQYEGLLGELEGHVEMGIRMLLPEQGVKRQQEQQPVNGRNYLVLRKSHYRLRDETSQHHQMLLDRYIQALSGLYCKCRTETATKDGAVVLSLYFLITKGKVNLFRESFQRVAENGISRTLISGPWPPYNFVTPDLPPGDGAGLIRVQ